MPDAYPKLKENKPAAAKSYRFLLFAYFKDFIFIANNDKITGGGFYAT